MYSHQDQLPQCMGWKTKERDYILLFDLPVRDWKHYHRKQEFNRREGVKRIQ
jgi:hypothetical protein